MIEGSRFQRAIPENGPASENSKAVKKLLFCSGKIYYELIKEREKINRVSEIAVSRIEQVRMCYCVDSCDCYDLRLGLVVQDSLVEWEQGWGVQANLLKFPHRKTKQKPQAKL